MAKKKLTRFQLAKVRLDQIAQEEGRFEWRILHRFFVLVERDGELVAEEEVNNG